MSNVDSHNTCRKVSSHTSPHGDGAQVKQGDDAWRQRLPFVYPATDRKMVKEVLVEMTKVAKAALKPKGETGVQD